MYTYTQLISVVVIHLIRLVMIVISVKEVSGERV